MAYFLNPNHHGLEFVGSDGDGYSTTIRWNIAYPNNTSNAIAYNIYYSTNQYEVFNNGTQYAMAQYVSWDGSLSATIPDLTPGQLYYFGVRAVEYDPIIVNPSLFPQANGLGVYPTSVLVEDITETSLTIPLLSTEEFPSTGVIQVGVEYINYLMNDTTNNTLILTNLSQRGYDGTIITGHDTDGYDGFQQWSPVVSSVLGLQELNAQVLPTQSRFEFPNYAYTATDGYHQTTKDILTTDLSASDAYNTGFAPYDYAGYHRTDPVQLLSGGCVGSYIGGEQGCADGYSGVGRMIRGLSFQQRNNQRQELLLSLTGEPVCLLKKQWTGITCPCYLASSEYPDDRCPICFGTKFVVGWNQYFDPRRADGRIMVRFSQTDDDLKMYEAGLESEFNADVWTLTVPTVKDRDVIVRFDQDDNEEFRYEILSVNRNRTLTRLEGAQKFKVQRVRKTDVIYQIPVFRNTQYYPTILQTDPASVPGIPIHTHTFQWSEKGTGLAQQTSGVTFGHNHAMTLGPDGNPVVQTILGHTHGLSVLGSNIQFPPYIDVPVPEPINTNDQLYTINPIDTGNPQ